MIEARVGRICMCRVEAGSGEAIMAVRPVVLTGIQLGIFHGKDGVWVVGQ
jgi:hypothetical protein